MNHARRVLTWATKVVLTAFVSISAATASPWQIEFKSGSFTPTAGEYQIPQSGIHATDADRVHVLLQLENYLEAGDRERLQAEGIELLSYLPDRAYVATVPVAIETHNLAGLGIRSITPFWAEYKLHPRVTNQRFGPWSDYKDGRRILAVEIAEDVSIDKADALLKFAGFESGHRFEAINTLLVACEPAKVTDLAMIDFVQWIDESPPPPDELNDVVRTRLHVNEVQADPYNLSGQGVNIMVYDGGMIDSTHPDFNDRVTWLEDGAIAEHPTHVAGTAGGDGTNSDGNYRGMAPGARIISGEYDLCVPYCLYESPNDFNEDYTLARTEHEVEITTNSIGANISSNGYNCEWMGDYETTSRLLDRFARNVAGRPMIMCFSAGNERGDAGCALATYRCLSVPAGAKNIITVGATTSSDLTATFSSWGPTDDGRIKPEVCATGVSVTSTVPGGGYGDLQGTSMSCPATAGVCCLILEKWHQMFPGVPDPLPETMKAILINSTNDINPAGPDFQTGFGLVNALKSILNVQNGGVLESSLEIGETFERQFTVPANTPVLDVSMAWSDIPASGNVTPTLVNDLNLRLVAPDGTISLPWTLLAANPASPAQRNNDSVNVCERVTVAAPSAGTWTLRVTGRVNSGTTQSFGLCANVTLVSDWATVTGTVLNQLGVGVPGEVSVEGTSQRAWTGLAGEYTLILPGNATYNMTGRAYGYGYDNDVVTVGTGVVQHDFEVTPAQNGTLAGTVTNQFGDPVAGATITAFYPNVDLLPATSDADGHYSMTLAGLSTYDVTCISGVIDANASAEIFENSTTTLNFTLADPRFDPATDDYGYFAYEITDPGLSAEYDWLEISPDAAGPGTELPHPATGNDWVTTITAPFPVSFYGIQSTTLRVGADGWVAVGTGIDGNTYSNQPIPAVADPNKIICLFWDDLFPFDPVNGGDISTYHDVANGRFIIEFREVPHFNPRTNIITGQIVIYNQQVRQTLTGDNEIVLQYEDLDYADGIGTDADASVGIENATGTDGIQIVYGGGYSANCFDIAPGTALRFTTGAFAGYGVVRGQLTMHPNPPDITQVAIQLGAITMNPIANGSFVRDSIPAITYTASVNFAGYEAFVQPNFVVTEGDTAVLNMELWRLDPARNLTGTYDWQNPRIDLNWQRPISVVEEFPANFIGYEINLAGRGVQDTVPDTFFVYDVTQSRAYNFWIRTLYNGGASDTSNHYRITVDLAAEDEQSTIPQDYYLAQNYPNPFNPTTTIEYGLPKNSHVTLSIYNVLGMKVGELVNGEQPAGVHRLQFNGLGLASGIYYARIDAAGEFVHMKKMLLLK